MSASLALRLDGLLLSDVADYLVRCQRLGVDGSTPIEVLHLGDHVELLIPVDGIHRTVVPAEPTPPRSAVPRRARAAAR